MPQRVMQSISVRLLRRVLSVYLLVTLMVFLGQMLVEFRLEERKVQDSLELAERTFSSPLTHAAWNLDTEQIQITVDGMVEWPHIGRVAVVDESQRVLASADSPYYQLGTGYLDEPVSVTFELRHQFDHRAVKLGTVEILTSRRAVLERLTPTVLVALLGVGTLHLVNEVRGDQYREGLARGTFRLMADNLLPMNEVERKRALVVWSRLLGIPLELQALSEVPLESSERNRLQRGHVLVQQTGPHSARVYGLLDGKQPLLLTGEIQQISEQLARATNYLLIDELVRYPVHEQPQRLAELKAAKQFGFAHHCLSLLVHLPRRLCFVAAVLAKSSKPGLNPSYYG